MKHAPANSDTCVDYWRSRYSRGRASNSRGCLGLLDERKLLLLHQRELGELDLLLSCTTITPQMVSLTVSDDMQAGTFAFVTKREK